MLIIGCDYHPGFQQIAFLDRDTGVFQEKRLAHPTEAEQFYRGLAATGQKVRVGMEASGQSRWFERLLGELQLELWIGDAAQIRAKRVRKQKTDRQDAQHILNLLVENRFPRIWVPSGENRDLRQLPYLSRAFLRGLHTTTLATCGFNRSYNQAAQVPSSKVTDRVPRSPAKNSRMVAAFVSRMDSITTLPAQSITATEIVA